MKLYKVRGKGNWADYIFIVLQSSPPRRLHPCRQLYDAMGYRPRGGGVIQGYRPAEGDEIGKIHEYYWPDHGLEPGEYAELGAV